MTIQKSSFTEKSSTGGIFSAVMSTVARNFKGT